MMNKEELRKSLKDQHISLAEAVQDKLEYLQSDNVFLEEDNVLKAENNVSDGNDEFAEAFGLSADEEIDDENQDIESTFNSEVSASLNSTGTESSMPRETSRSAHVSQQSVAARIAALRGISLPGDNLPRKH